MTRSLDDTIAAVATPPGFGGVAILRVSGPKSSAIAGNLLFTAENAPLTPLPRHAHYCRARSDTGMFLDEVLALFMPGPASYTREDVLEIQCHGGRAAASLILDEILKFGARLAEPGEFTLRAFLNGRIDLVQAEAVADVINASSSEALKVHGELLSGALSREVAAWQEKLGRVLVHLETSLDFPEEEISIPDTVALLSDVEAVISAMRVKLDSFAWGRTAREGFRVAILGAPNVGKSSLLNRIADEERAIVSPRAGTTRDVIEARVNIFGAPVTLLDTAGLRTAQDEIEEEGVARARRAAEEADLVLFVLDGTREPTPEESGEAAFLSATGREVLFVVNKSDLAVCENIQAALPAEAPLFHVSAFTGSGVDGLLLAVRERSWNGQGTARGEGALTRLRHRQAVESAFEALLPVVDLLKRGLALDAAASSLHSARARLNGLLGWGAPEDVLDSIFQEFCIGK